MCSVSFHRIFPAEESHRDDVEEVDQIHSEDRDRSRDLPSCDDREGREGKGEHHRSRVPHESSSRDIEPSQEECHWDEYHEDREDEATIFLTRSCRIDKVELRRESHKDEE